MAKAVDRFRLKLSVLEQARVALFLTPNELAGRVGTNPATICKIRKGAAVTIPMARRLAKALRVPLPSLIDKVEGPAAVEAQLAKVG